MSQPIPSDELIAVGELLIRPRQATVTARGRVLRLSRREFGLLMHLVEQEGCIVSRETLHEMTWGTPYERRDRSVDVYVHKLRSKLAAALPEWEYIHTHVGFGYRLQPEPSHHRHPASTDP